MSDYLQPGFYRFNEDSLKLVNWLAARNPVCTHLLDLGAGSGVIGIELCNRLNIHCLTLVEAQEDFIPAIEANIQQQLKVPAQVEFVHQSFGEWTPREQYDLIVCNPPYYLKDHGEPSPDVRKNIARSFVLDDWSVLLKLVSRILRPEGKAYFVVKNDQRILKEVKGSLNDLELTSHEVEKLLILELSSTGHK
jgi:tRNA1Val (adenine37-N6)-methyltransferase